jgi:DNA-binding transcriptional ArsR family regulator
VIVQGFVEAGIGDMGGSILVANYGENFHRAWADVARDMARHFRVPGGQGIEQPQTPVLVVDTADKWLGLSGDAENSAGAVNAAIGPLRAIRDEFGAIIFLLHHTRKAEGSLVEQARGSSALAGAVDAIWRLSRFDHGQSNQRKLETIGRFGDEPEELIIELRDDGYHALDVDPAEAAILRAIADGGGDGQTREDIAAKTGVDDTTLRRHLKNLEAAGRVVVEGKGVRGDPKRYRRGWNQAEGA